MYVIHMELDLFYLSPVSPGESKQRERQWGIIKRYMWVSFVNMDKKIPTHELKRELPSWAKVVRTINENLSSTLQNLYAIAKAALRGK